MMYDSPLPCMQDLCFWLSPTGPRIVSADGSRVSRFSRVVFLCVHGVFDSAGPRRTRITHVAMLPSGSFYPVGTPDFCFRSSMASPHIPLSNASSASLRAALAWLGAKMGRYSFLV